MGREEWEQTKMVLQFEGIDDSTDGKILCEPMTVLAWSYGASMGYESQEGASPSWNAQDISLTKYVSAQSPLLMKYISLDKHIKHATLTVTNKNQSIILKFHDIQISSCSLGGSGGEEMLTENITLQYGSVEYMVEDLLNKKPQVSSSNLVRSGTNSPRRY